VTNRIVKSLSNSDIEKRIRFGQSIGNSHNYEVLEHSPNHLEVEFNYPEMDETHLSKPLIEVNLCHVRAADGIQVKYDFNRDGWAIYQASTFSWDEDSKECDMDWKEVSFIQAWQREKEEEV